jgi:hypothetical protein
MGVQEHTRNIHLTGCVPLSDAEAVFRTVSDILGERLKRLPDGETGARSHWIAWQYSVFERNPAFVRALTDPNAEALLPRELRHRHFALASSSVAETPTFDNLGYADAALASYATFARLKAEGVIPAHYRFQVSLPTPIAPVAASVVLDHQAAVLPAYAARMLAEVAAISTAVPHDQLAFQWDVAVEVGVLEGVFPIGFDDADALMFGWLTTLGNVIPPDVELGYHLCYGMAARKHFREPEDTSRLVDLANRISSTVQRSIQWVHMPVPPNRSDAAYFAPLSRLRLHPETELYLGLVHLVDGVAGTRQRMAAAEMVVPHFGVASECGLGWEPAETLVPLLQLYAAVC